MPNDYALPPGVDDHHDDVVATLRELSTIIGRQLESHERPVGFALLFFDFGPGGYMHYCSNAQREDMKRALRELLQRWEDKDA